MKRFLLVGLTALFTAAASGLVGCFWGPGWGRGGGGGGGGWHHDR